MSGIQTGCKQHALRLTRLAPDIIEAILTGNEPSGLSLTKLTQMGSAIWEEQMAGLGFVAQ